MDDQSLETAKLAFEREKWEAEQRRLDQEFALRKQEVCAKDKETRRARLWNPLVIAICGAAIAAFGNVFVSYHNATANLNAESLKAESARILEVLKTGNPDVAAKNLAFLVEIGLIQTQTTASNITAYLAKRKQGDGVALPASSSADIGYCYSIFRALTSRSRYGTLHLPDDVLNMSNHAISNGCDIEEMHKAQARLDDIAKSQ